LPPNTPGDSPFRTRSQVQVLADHKTAQVSAMHGTGDRRETAPTGELGRTGAAAGHDSRRWLAVNIASRRSRRPRSASGYRWP
jgi:hypothetical protein